MTLNLHCWQEPDGLAKLHTVARAIAAQGIDVVMFQEAAQHKDAAVTGVQHGVTIKADNAVAIIADRLASEFNLAYEYAWDYSHLGWDVWEEGVAVLTRGKILDVESKWVSESHSTTDWLSRKALFAEIQLDDNTINVVSTHLGWWNFEREPFADQFSRLYAHSFSKWFSTLVAGDFNVAATTAGYEFMMNHDYLIDCWLECNPHAMLEPTIGGRIDGWEDGDPDGQRIDYMLVDQRGGLRPLSAHTLFGEGDYGTVSDHLGVVIDFEIAHERRTNRFVWQEEDMKYIIVTTPDGTKRTLSEWAELRTGQLQQTSGESAHD